MNCTDFHLLLQDHLDGALDAGIEAELLEHAAACASCAARRDAGRRLGEALRSLPVPPPSPGFAERVFSGARAAQPPGGTSNGRQGSVGWPVMAGGIAASLALALVFWASRDNVPVAGGEPPVAFVQPAAAGGAQPVRLVFRSDSALSDVTIELGLPEGVELAGYPGRRQLVWQSDLKAGANLLELPVLVHGPGGVVTATLNHGTERRQFSVRVVSAPEGATGASPRMPQRGALPAPAAHYIVS